MFDNLGLSLCTPARVYLIISVISIIIMLIMHRYFPNINCIGNYNCDKTDLASLLAIKIIYVIFWTWLLNLICSKGGDAISWILVILPFISLFFLVTPYWRNV